MANTLTQWKYGGYTHAQGLVRVVKHETIPVKTERNNRAWEWRKIDIEFELQETGTALNTAINNLRDAYSVNDQNAGLYWPDGTKTAHFLDQNDAQNWSGNKVLYRSWDDLDPGQLTNARSGRIVVGALFKNADSEILSYRDDVEIIGSGGPDWEWVKTSTGQPYQRQTYEFTPQYVIQTGYIYTVSFWAFGNVPPPILPQFEFGRQRRIRRLYPKFFGQRFGNHGLGWQYVMQTTPGYPIPTQTTPF